MIRAYFALRDHAQRAQSAIEDLGLDAKDPQMSKPVMGRSWMVEVDGDLTTENRQSILQVSNRYDGVLKTEPGPQSPVSQRPGGAPFMNSLPQSVVDRYEDGRSK